ETDGFSYDLPFTGVLPTMPSISGTYDQATLEALVTSFVNAGEDEWYNGTDTYWSGKGYGKVAETAALAQSIGMEDAAAELIAWLKVELADWFTAETDGELDINKYFVYDETWDALLGIEEAYGSHQRMADHHFHYGYFVRAAAEICRVDVAWCGDDQYGPMIELLIRDYAGDDSEEMFPKLRNFDPANGFSWADGKGDTIQGNNNESTSEAANAYGAMVLYGLAVGNDAIVEKGMYMHASTSAAFWQYWNNIDGYNNLGADYDNFAPGYDKITTSIIWGSGADFSTWFSPAYAHILGIQGLPSNPLILYVGQYADYMESYVELGMTESSNGNPSGLAGDQWTDLWWNLWAMTDADAALADYNNVGTNYDAEAGESKAHTYHWLHTFKALGHLKTGTGELTANDASALAFDKDGLRTYVVYNFTDQSKAVTYSDGRIVNALANSFTIKTSDDPQGSLDSDSDGGATDGSTDGGTTDGGADGSDAEVSDIIDMTGSFGRAELQGSSYSFPTGSEVWAGFANVNTNVYPFTFANGGSISFTAAVPAGGNDTNVYFRFERLPFPDIEPSFNLAPVLIAGETEMEYTVTIPAQNAANTYASFLLYIIEQDQTVIIRDIVVTDDSGSTDSAGGETTGGGSNDADPVISTVTVFDDGVVGSAWDGDIVAWDAFLAGTCMNDGGAGCPSIDWTLVSDNERGDVLQVSHSEEGHFASLIFSSHLSPQDLSAFSQGSLIFDIKVLSGDSNISIEVLCVLPCRTSVIPIESNDLTDWETVSIPVERLVAEGLDLRSVDTGLIIFATNYTGTVFQLDNIRWEQSSNGGSTDGGNADDDASDGGSTDGGSTDGGFSSPPLNIFSDGAVDPFWDSGINGYDSSIDWQECNNDGGQACPNIDWQIVSDDYRGDVLMVSHTGNQVSTGLYIGASSVQDLSAYAGGYFIYDIKIVAAGDNSLVSSRVNCWYPCTSGSMGVGTLEGDWKTEKIPVDFLVETGLDLSAVSSLVFDLTDDGDQNVVILLDKIRFEAANDDGSTDGGTTNGFTDGGTTDVGSVDGGANERASIEMIEGFGGAVFDEASSSYIFPTGSEVWAGFANLNTDVYPFTFANGGSVTFTAAIPAGGSDTNIYFSFERLPHPDVEPSFNLDPILIFGETELQYTVAIPAQDPANTYESFNLYLVDQDSSVIIKDIVVTDDTGSTGDEAGSTNVGSTDGGTTDGGTTDGSARSGSVEMVDGFGGAVVDGNTFTYPSGAEVWAGFANLNFDIYPFTFANGGSISFTAAVPNGGSDTSVYFRFERLPYPDIEPSFNLASILISGEAEQQYTVTIPAQDAANTYSSFLMYVVEQDSPVIVKDIVVTDDTGSTGDGSGDGGTVDGGFSSPPLNIFSDGAIDPFWDLGIGGYDSSIGWGECNNDGGEACPNIQWQIAYDDFRGDVLMVSHTGNQGDETGLYIGASTVQDLSAFAGGYYIYDIKIVTAGDNSRVSSRVHCWYPCTSGSMGVGTLEGDWKTEKIPVDFLVETGLDLSAVSSFVFDLTDDGDESIVILLDKIRFEAANDDGSTDGDGSSDGGSTDGSTDGGSTDGGSTDGGSTDGGTQDGSFVQMIEGFGGAFVDGNTFIYPSGAEDWAGFANLNTDIFPFTFDNGGSVSFTAAVAAGGADTNIYFRFERLPFPDVDPSFNLDPVTISGETELEYTITIPAQTGGNTYESLLMYVVEQDSPVIIKNIIVNDDGGATGGTTDGGTTDGGTTDGGTTDGGTTDGGTTDGGTTDGGTTDGGTTDGGTTDGGSTDGGSFEPTLPAQSINLAGTPMAMMGNSLQLRFNYNVDNNDNTLPGLGLRVHFDSSVLSFAGATALIDKDLMFAGSDALFDVDDYDNNLDTDSYVDFAWASIGGDWPSEILPVALIDMSFDVTIETIKQVTPIGFSYSSLPSGYRLIAEEYSLPVISGGWDIDRNGQADPLTDGMLFMRYAFGLRGYNLIDGVVAPDASIVSEGEIEASLAYAFDFIGDIDGNGSVDALTDGLLLTRYLFGFTGDALIDAIVAEDATRTSAADIEAYIQSMMPNQ
ncbi:MAG: glycosyl hydrolase, partial [Porticoccaceae bacterium]|nr:glycosyl hydrolase [Porticoccaceae bacterium]